MKKYISLAALVSAAAISTTAYADFNVGPDGLPIITDFSSVSKEVGGEGYTLTGNTVLTYQNDANTASTGATDGVAVNTATHDLVLQGTTTEGNEITIAGKLTGGGDVWFKKSRWAIDSADYLAEVGDIYISTNAQLQVTQSQEFANNFFLGSTEFSTDGDLANCSMRFGAWHNQTNVNISLTGTTTILDSGTKIGFQKSASLTIQKLSGKGDLTTGLYDGTSTLTIGNTENYSGAISLANNVTLNWSNSSATFGGLNGTAQSSVAGGTTLSIVTAENDSHRFLGTVGSAESSVNVNISGSGTQTFEGTSHLGAVTVADGATLLLKGTPTVSTEITGAGTVQLGSWQEAEKNYLDYYDKGFLETFEGIIEIVDGGDVRLGNRAQNKFANASSLKVSTGGELSFWGATMSHTLELAGGTVRSGGAAITLAGAITLSADSTINATHQTTISGAISGAGKLTKIGDGTLSLGTANSYTGGTKITGGTLEITNKAALGTGDITIESDATLKQNVADNNGMDGATYKYILAGGTLHTAGGNTSDGCAQIGTGEAITLTANSTIKIDNHFGMIAKGHAQNILNLNGNTLTKKGTGSFWLSNTEITEGIFEIAEGTVVLVKDNEGKEGYDLDGSEATFKIHAGKGQLDLTGQDACSLTVAGMTIVVSESYSETTKAAITEGVSLTVEGGPIKIEKADSFALENVVESSLSYYIVDENSTWDSEWTADDFSLEGDWGSWEISAYNKDTGLLTLTAVPEPSAFGLLAGLGALALVASRRRRK